MSSFLTEGGPAVKLEVGETFEGTVLSISELDDRKPDGTTVTWDDGTPKKVWVFNLENSDGETVSLWVRGNLVKTIRVAAREAKVATSSAPPSRAQHRGRPAHQEGVQPAEAIPGQGHTRPRRQPRRSQADEEDPFGAM
jgi:hypothetical protein